MTRESDDVEKARAGRESRAAAASGSSFEHRRAALVERAVHQYLAVRGEPGHQPDRRESAEDH